MVIGIDFGSVAVSMAVISRDRRWIDSAYAFHHGDPAGTLKNLLARLNLRGGTWVAVTGTTAKTIRAHDYDSASRAACNRSGFSLLQERKRAFTLPEPRPAVAGIRLGLPAALHLAEDVEFSQVFFAQLAIPILTREPPNDPIARANAAAEFCAPMAVLQPEVDFLLSRADYVFLPLYLEEKRATRPSAASIVTTPNMPPSFGRAHIECRL